MGTIGVSGSTGAIGLNAALLQSLTSSIYTAGVSGSTGSTGITIINFSAGTNNTTNVYFPINVNYLYNIASFNTTTSTALTLNLPSPVTYNGNVLIFKYFTTNHTSTTITLVPTGATLDKSSSSIPISPNYTAGFLGRVIVTLQSDGTTWWLTNVSNF